MKRMTVEDLHALQTSGRPFVLLDVRESSELTMAALPGAVHIPMRSVPARIGELNPGAEIAVMCHHGGRSEQVAHFLHARGFSNVHNVEGGIDAYALRVDPKVRRY